MQRYEKNGGRTNETFLFLRRDVVLPQFFWQIVLASRASSSGERDWLCTHDTKKSFTNEKSVSGGVFPLSLGKYFSLVRKKVFPSEENIFSLRRGKNGLSPFCEKNLHPAFSLWLLVCRHSTLLPRGRYRASTVFFPSPIGAYPELFD
ncbi:MAG: hypothetical protein K5683_06910 [Prevotella sp.]|nr:hypothetical protein [Prevotella sp.]